MTTKQRKTKKTKNNNVGWWEWLKRFVKTNTSLAVIIAAALLLELTTAVLFYSAQSIIQGNVEQLMEREMNALYLCIRNKLINVEVTVDNMAWVVNRDLENAEWMYEITQMLVEKNPVILGGGIPFVPNYYPEKGRWFEPSAVRRPDGTVESLQIGSAQHDYTKSEFFTVPIATGKGHWCERYMDNVGTKSEVTTYGVPVYDDDGKVAAVVIADISLGWLEDILNEKKVYKSTQRFLVTGSYGLLAGDDNADFRKVLNVVKADDDQKAYFTMRGASGQKVHVFYTPVGGKTDWILINIVDDGDVFGRLRNIRVLLLLPVMIGLFFAGFIVWRSSRNLERLRKVNAEKERIGGELRVASQIQQSMLPGQNLQHDDVEFFGSLVPAREVGGDLYDYFIRDEKLFFCIGDVSGKGAPSAMVMSVIHSLFRAFSAHENNPARIMQAINENSCRGNESNMFVTMFIGVLDLPTGRLRYCDAGHDAPMFMTDGKCMMLDVIPHLPVGVFDDVKYGVQEVQMTSGSSMFLYTDGLTEAMNLKHKQFGIKRVEEAFAANCQLPPRQLLEAITNKVHEFVGDAVQSDDLTMLAIHYMPKHFESTLTEKLMIKNDVQDVSKFSAFMKSVLKKLNIEKSLARQLRLAVEEAVVNVIDYAYPSGIEGDIEIHIMSDGGTLKTIIIDSGVAFDPTAKEKADTSLSAEDRQIGGLGILLVRELMDAINYERENGKNILTLIKTI